jgi:hypothetical protein
LISRALLLSAIAFFAAPSAFAGPAPASAPAAAVRARASAISTVARDVAAALPEQTGRVVVAVAPLESDVKATLPDALVLSVASLVAGARGYEAPTATEPLRAAVARSRGARAVVYVSVRVERGKLTVTADVHPVPATVWARIKNPTPGSVAHAFATADLDAEVRAHLEPIPLTAALAGQRGQHFENDVLAVACGDLDRDGGNEIVAVSADQVTALRLRGGKVQPMATRLWSDLSPVDATPWREPIASAVVTAPSATDPLAPRDVVVSTTSRAKAVRLDPALELRASFPGFVVPSGRAYACARLDGLEVTGPLEACGPDEPAPGRASVGGRFDAVAGATLIDRGGGSFDVWAGREAGTVQLFDGAGHTAKLEKAGAQLAIADLDQDGAPEILTSLDVEPRAGRDALVIYTWLRDGKPPKEQLRMPFAAGVRAIGVCPPDGPGRAPLVVATAGDLVVLR